MAAILVGLLIVIGICLFATDGFFITKKTKNRTYSNQNKYQYKPKKQYEVKSKSVTYLPSQPQKQEYTVTPQVEEIPKKEEVNQVRSTRKERIVNKRDRGYSRPEHELRGLVKDDGAVDRLIIALIDRYPDRSREWCADKALGDWLRDRH
jgi:hypothetical protein